MNVFTGLCSEYSDWGHLAWSFDLNVSSACCKPLPEVAAVQWRPRWRVRGDEWRSVPAVWSHRSAVSCWLHWKQKEITRLHFRVSTYSPASCTHILWLIVSAEKQQLGLNSDQLGTLAEVLSQSPKIHLERRLTCLRTFRWWLPCQPGCFGVLAFRRLLISVCSFLLKQHWTFLFGVSIVRLLFKLWAHSGHQGNVVLCWNRHE